MIDYDMFSGEFIYVIHKKVGLHIRTLSLCETIMTFCKFQLKRVQLQG